MKEIPGISESEFNMWRAVFAFAYADNSLSLEEQELLGSYLKKVDFSYAQREVLRTDLRIPKDAVALFRNITDPKDKERFCILARAIVWCEGSIGEQESEILRRISCLQENADRPIFRRSRHNPHIHDYYQQYARSGLTGLLRPPPDFIHYG